MAEYLLPIPSENDLCLHDNMLILIYLPLDRSIDKFITAVAIVAPVM